MKIPFFTLSRLPETFKGELQQAVISVLNSGDLAHGKLARTFEDRYADYTGYKHCALLSSGTEAIFINALYLKEKFGLKNVYCPANTFIASAAPFALLGSKVKFLDVDNTCNSGVEQLLKYKIHDNDILVAVSLYGNIVDLQHIKAVFPKLYILHDSSQAAGGKIRDGSFSKYADSECQSMYVTKNLGGITEGGCLLTNDRELYDFAVHFRNHGRDSNAYEFSSLGLNARSSEINAAVLNVKLPYLEPWNFERQVIANIYKTNLGSCNKISVPVIDTENLNVYHLFPIFVNNRDKVRAELEKRGISTGTHYNIPLPKQKAFEKFDYSKEKYPKTEELADKVITLPMFQGLRQEEIDFVSENLIEILDALS